MTSETKGLTKEQDQLFKALTRLQQRVCWNILNGMTQRQAYREAGGKASDIALDGVVSVMTKNAKVKAFMDSMYAHEASQEIMQRDEAMQILSGFGRAPLLNSKTRIQAMERLARMQGWDAAQKHDLTGHILTSEVPLTDAQRAALDRVLEDDV